MALEIIHVPTQNAFLDTFTTQLNSGSTNPTSALRIFTAGQATLLATVLLANPPFPAAAGGAITANPTTRDESGDATGTAAIAIFVDRNGVGRYRGTVTLEGGTGDVQLKGTTTITAGQPFEIASISLNYPAPT